MQIFALLLTLSEAFPYTNEMHFPAGSFQTQSHTYTLNTSLLYPTACIYYALLPSNLSNKSRHNLHTYYYFHALLRSAFKIHLHIYGSSMPVKSPHIHIFWNKAKQKKKTENKNKTTKYRVANFVSSKSNRENYF